MEDAAPVGQNSVLFNGCCGRGVRNGERGSSKRAWFVNVYFDLKTTSGYFCEGPSSNGAGLFLKCLLKKARM